MGNERFGFGQGELERLLQKLPNPLLDFLGFAVWSTDYVSSGSSSRKTSSESSTEDT
jgi:hypothetical protein